MVGVDHRPLLPSLPTDDAPDEHGGDDAQRGGEPRQVRKWRAPVAQPHLSGFRV